MNITPFGLVFIPTGLFILAFSRNWLLPLLVVSAGLHAFAVVTVGHATAGVRLGVPAWLFTCCLIFIHLLVKLIRDRVSFSISNNDIWILFFGWMVYVGWCIFSAFTLPFIFEGLPVHALAKFDGFDTPAEPLVWHPVNAIQAVNTTIIGMIMVYILSVMKNTANIQRLFIGFIVSIVLSISLSAYQRFKSISYIHSNEFSLPITIPIIDFFELSLNPSYASGIQFFGIFIRLNWPFSEPSYASVWYTGFFVGGFALYLLGKNIGLSLLFFFGGAIGLLNSMGASGLGGSAVGVFLVFVFSLVSIIQRPEHHSWYSRRLFALCVFVGFIILIYKMKIYSEFKMADLYQIGFDMFYDRINRPNGSRQLSNIFALQITRETWGLGVGLGSNRASSYLLAMLSSIGVLGLILFCFSLFKQTLMLAREITSYQNTFAIFILGGSIGVFSGMVLGIPDLNFPAWWIWIIAGFAVIASRAKMSTCRQSHLTV